MTEPQSANYPVDLPCVCGHSREEHHDPKYPISTECFVDGCDCTAYEADRGGDDE